MNELDIFTAALELADPEARARFLDDSCGAQSRLRDRIEALLSNAAGASQFLETPAGRFAGEMNTLVSGADLAPAISSDLDRTQPALEPEGVNLDFLVPSDDPAALGSLGQYTVTDVIGRGGMGIVFKARDTRLHRVVAIKVLSPNLAASATARKRFLREAQAAAAVSHDHIVTIHAVEDGPPPYLVMELIDGQSLQEKLDHGGPLELREILRIGRQIAAGLAAAHVQGLIHRDVKPANILLKNGIQRVQITDFGLARAANDPSLTHPGQIAGTPQYMSPEQAQGRSIDHRSDLFSLGSVLYAMCTGGSPFRAETTMGALRRVCDESPRPIRELNPDVPVWLADIVNRLLAKNADERIQTAAEVDDLLSLHLAALQNPNQVQLPALSSTNDSRRHRPDRRWLVAAIVVLAALAGLGLAEGTGVTHLVATVLRIPTADGTLIVEVDDPSINVLVEGDGGLVITGAGAQEIRLKPGHYKLKATIGNQPIKTEVLTIARGDRKVVTISVEPPPLASAADLDVQSAAIHQPFVILASGNNGERSFATLVDAVTSSHAGDTIEVRGNGSFVVDPIVISRALTIRAADGYRPVISLDPEKDESSLTLLSATAPLVLEGLVILRTTRFIKVKPKAIVQSLSSLRMANCRLISTANHNGLWSTGPIVLRHCEFLAAEPGAATAVSWNLTSGGRCTIENCVMTGKIFIPFASEDLDSTAAIVRINRNTVAGSHGIQLALTSRPRRPLSEPREAAIQLLTSGNLFESRSPVVLFDQFGMSEPLPADAAEAFLRAAIDCHDEQNLYSTASGILTVCADLRPLAPTKDLAEWNRFWGFSETGSSQGLIRFQGGDLLTRAKVGVPQITSEYFRLLSDSAGYRAGPDGKDLGADIDFVGPGRAYERWKQTPEYQLWLKDSGQLSATRPPPGQVRTFAHHSADHVDAVALSPDGRRALSAGSIAAGQPVCFVWDVATGQELARLTRHTDVIQSVAFAPDSRLALTGSMDQTVRLWDVETGGELRRFDCPGHVSSVAWSQDGLHALFGTFEGTVILCDVDKWSEIRRVDHGAGLWSVDYCPTQHWALTAGGKASGTGHIGHILLWNLDTGTELRRFEGHSNGVWRAIFSPDARHVLSASSDRTLCLWNVESGQKVRSFEGHSGQVFSVAFASDGQSALSGGEDNMLRLWDISSGAELHRFQGHTRMVRGVALSRDGHFALSGGFDSTLRLWRLPPPATAATNN